MVCSPGDYFANAQVNRRVALDRPLNAPSLERQVSALFGLVNLAAEAVSLAVADGSAIAAEYAPRMWFTYVPASQMLVSILQVPSDVDCAASNLFRLGSLLRILGETMSDDGLIGKGLAKTFIVAGRAVEAYARNPYSAAELLQIQPSLVQTGYLANTAKIVMGLAVAQIIGGMSAVGDPPASQESIKAKKRGKE